MMQATIKYRLSSEGQKAALLAGQPGASDRVDKIEIPPEAVPYFEVDYKGNLNAALTTGAKPEAWSGGWNTVEFDAPLTMEKAIEFLQQREQGRKTALALKAAAKAEQDLKDAAEQAAQRAEDLVKMQEAVAAGVLPAGITCRSYEEAVELRTGTGATRSYKTDDPDPEVASAVKSLRAMGKAAEDKKAAAEKAEKARQGVLAKIPSPPVLRIPTLHPDGSIEITVPIPNQGEGWAKLVTSVNTAAANGTAFDGNWLNCGGSYRRQPGDVIVVGAKWNTGSNRRPDWHRSRDLYVVTPAGLVWTTPNSPQRAKDLLAQDVQERITALYKARVETCKAQLAKYDALVGGEFADYESIIQERRAAWSAEFHRFGAALEKAEAEPAIESVEQAAEAILRAGYRALAAQHHPDKGGDLATMKLLNEARQALTDLLTLAKGVDNE